MSINKNDIEIQPSEIPAVCLHHFLVKQFKATAAIAKTRAMITQTLWPLVFQRLYASVPTYEFVTIQSTERIK